MPNVLTPAVYDELLLNVGVAGDLVLLQDNTSIIALNTGQAQVPAIFSDLLMVDNTSLILLTDNTSVICLNGPVLAFVPGDELLLSDALSSLLLVDNISIIQLNEAAAVAAARPLLSTIRSPGVAQRTVTVPVVMPLTVISLPMTEVEGGRA